MKGIYVVVDWKNREILGAYGRMQGAVLARAAAPNGTRVGIYNVDLEDDDDGA